MNLTDHNASERPTTYVQQIQYLAGAVLHYCHASLSELLNPPTRGANGATLAMQLVSATPMAMGTPCVLSFRLTERATGKPLGPEALKTLHTEKIHTIIIDDALGDYHHLHPTYDHARGLFQVHFTPATTHRYTAWHEATAQGNTRSETMRTPLPGGSGHALPPTIHPQQNVSAHGLDISIEASPPLQMGVASVLTITLRRDGKVIQDLSPIMGAYAHLAAFCHDGEHLIHTHPLGATPQSAATQGAGILQFHLAPHQQGPIQCFLQVNYHGQPLAIPFGQWIQPSRKFVTRAQQPAQAAHSR